MHAIFLIPVVYFAALIEAALATHWEVRGIVPDLMALVALAWLAGARDRYGFVVVAIVGLMSDLGSSAPLGVGMAAFAIVGYAVMQLRRTFHLEGIAAQIAIVGCGALAVCLLQGAVLRITGHLQLPLLTLVERALFVGLYTTGIAIPLLMVVHWIKPRQNPTSIAAQTA